MLVLQLSFDLMTCLIHGVQLVYKVIVIGSGLSELLLHLVIVDLEGAQLQFKLISLQPSQLELAFELLNFLFALTVHFIEADHLPLVHLELTSRVLKILHQSLGLLFIDMEELFSLFQLKGQMLFLAHQAVTGALEHIHLQLHLSVFFLGVLNFVPEQIKRVLDLLCPDVIFFELSALNGELTLV